MEGSDVRAIVRLLADVAVTTGGVVAQKRCLVGGLAELIQADRWMWNLTRFQGDGPAVAVSMLHNFTEQQFAKLVESNANGEMREFDDRFIELSRRTPHWAMHIDDFVSLNRSEPVAIPDIWNEMEELDGECIFAAVTVEGEQSLMSALGMHRASHREKFTEREVRIVQTVTKEVKWLHMTSVPEEKGQASADLTPRLQSVLHLLMEGHSAKRIAFLLKLSDHTVRGYIKAIYKHFDVSSRAELMRRFMVGDDGMPDKQANSESKNI
jgi:DNA-binding CsgD family transcriptional regulator